MSVWTLNVLVPKTADSGIKCHNIEKHKTSVLLQTLNVLTPEFVVTDIKRLNIEKIKIPVSQQTLNVRV